MLERASRRWWWIDRPGRDPEQQVLRMLARASGRAGHPSAPGEPERVAAATTGRPRQPGGWSAADLLAAVRHRRARHARRRLVAGGVTAVVVLAAAAWPVASAVRGTSAKGVPGAVSVTASGSVALPGPGSQPGPFPLGPKVRRAAGTVLRECADANNGELSKHWQAQSVHAGPVWFVFAKTRAWAASRRLRHGRLGGQAGVIAIQAGKRAVVRVTGPDRARFRFLPGFNSTDVYPAGSGLPGLTLGGCAGVFTMFWEGYISTAACVPLVVHPLPHGRAVHIALAAHRGACAAS